MDNLLGPNFIIGGTSAGGTSFLSTILVQHPQIYLPKEMRPEPHFFYKSWEYEKGEEYYLSRWFHNVPDSAKAVGERSSSYLFGGASVAKKIAQVYPNMKFIFTLRNPIERAWANYRYTVLEGLEDLSFDEALKEEQARVRGQSGIWAEIQPYNYTGRGFYAKQICDYYKYFPPENFLFTKSELLSIQTEIELQKIYEFLELTELNFQYKRTPDHTSGNVINPKLQMELRKYFGERFDKIIEAIRRQEEIGKYGTNFQDKEKIKQLKENMSGKKAPMSALAREFLYNLYLPDIKKLKQYIDFDIEDWK